MLFRYAAQLRFGQRHSSEPGISLCAVQPVLKCEGDTSTIIVAPLLDVYKGTFGTEWAYLKAAYGHCITPHAICL